jgi:hypothetical protein
MVKYQIAISVEMKHRSLFLRVRDLIGYEIISNNFENKVHDLVGVSLMNDVYELSVTGKSHCYAFANISVAIGFHKLPFSQESLVLSIGLIPFKRSRNPIGDIQARADERPASPQPRAILSESYET